MRVSAALKSNAINHTVYALEKGTRREFGRFYPPRPEWLATQTVESIREPDLPIIVTHFHVVDVPGLQYLAPAFAADMDTGHRIEGTVYSEAQTAYRASGPDVLRPVGETEFIVEQAAADPRIATGIVGYSDLLDMQTLCTALPWKPHSRRTWWSARAGSRASVMR